MLKGSRFALYGHQLKWLIERDRLDASFCRIGSGFLNKSILDEALETHNRISQFLIQIQMIQNSHTHIPLVEPLHHPLLEAQKSVPIYAHSKSADNQLL